MGEMEPVGPANGPGVSGDRAAGDAAPAATEVVAIMDASDQQMTDWAEMPAPSPEMMADWTRWNQDARAKRIEAARDAWYSGALGLYLSDLHRHDALSRAVVRIIERRRQREDYPAIFGVMR